MGLRIARIHSLAHRVQVYIHRHGHQSFCIFTCPDLRPHKLHVVHLRIQNLQKTLEGFDGRINHLVDQVSIPKIVKYIGRGCLLLETAFLILGVDVVGCLLQVADGLFFPVGVVQEADPDFVFQVVVFRIPSQQFLVDGFCFSILFEKEPRFGIGKIITRRVSLCLNCGGKKKQHQN